MLEPPAFALPGSLRSSRLRPFLVSLGIHAVAVAAMIAGHSGGMAVNPHAPRERSIPQERKIIWYARTLELPAVAPAELVTRPPEERKAPALVFHPRHSTVAKASRPESRRQMVLQSPPELRLERDLSVPNALVFNPPPAPKPRPRFRPPPAPVRVRPRTVSQLEAPRFSAAAPTPVLPIPNEPARLPLPRFQVPERKRSTARPTLPAEAPAVAMRNQADDTVARLQPVAPVARPQFVVPEPKGARRTPAAPPPQLVEAAPNVTAPMQPSTVVVGLDPVPGPLEIPPGNRSAEFSAGPQANGKGGETLTASAAPVRVPNLSIAAAAAAPTVTRPPLPTVNDRAALRRQLLSSIRRPGPFGAVARSGSPAGPEMVLNGATVYTMAIDMPNVTSYEGSWILRFTEMGGSDPDDILSAPVATRKVDPKYIAAAAAEGVEGKVLLYAVIRRDGRVDQVRLVQGIDERLDASAISAFSKWEFQPATKNGDPVDLEAVVHIPFRTGPRRRN